MFYTSFLAKKKNVLFLQKELFLQKKCFVTSAPGLKMNYIIIVWVHPFGRFINDY